jgi:hypothetical protein
MDNTFFTAFPAPFPFLTSLDTAAFSVGSDVLGAFFAGGLQQKANNQC